MGRSRFNAGRDPRQLSHKTEFPVICGSFHYRLGANVLAMKILLPAILALAATATLAADVDVTVRSHQFTTSSPVARFEVLQSTLAARWTFRLDRFTGRVWQLVKTKDDDNMWEEMKVFERPQVQPASRPRFQLFASGLAARHTFLLDGDTGKTWLVVTGKQKDKDGAEIEYQAWQPFAEQ